jgi:flavin reductase (DIM6/NTAB) family NADH-FMN oxidoreductase RutF
MVCRAAEAEDSAAAQTVAGVTKLASHLATTARPPLLFPPNTCILQRPSRGDGLFDRRGKGPIAMEVRSFRRVMGSLAAGVTVVTTRDGEGQPRGLTATAVCLVSLEPPLLLVCIDRTAECHEAFLTAESFAVHLLREGQEALSRRFARKDSQKFEGISHRQGTIGAPILADVLACVECQVHARYPGGDHTIFVGEAVHSIVAPPAEAGTPLVYFRGCYAHLGDRLPREAP